MPIFPTALRFKCHLRARTQEGISSDEEEAQEET